MRAAATLGAAMAAGALTLAGWALLFQGADSPKPPKTCQPGQYSAIVVGSGLVCADRPFYPQEPPVRAG